MSNNFTNIQIYHIMKKIKFFLLSGVSLLSYVAVSYSALGEGSETVVSGKLSTDVVDSSRNRIITITTTTTTTTGTVIVRQATIEKEQDRKQDKKQ